MTLETFVTDSLPYFGGFVGIILFFTALNAYIFYRMRQELRRIRILLAESLRREYLLKKEREGL